MLTPAQLATLKADILSNPAFVGWNLGTTAQEVAAWYNVEAAPAFVVWRTAVSALEWRAAIIGGGVVSTEPAASQPSLPAASGAGH